MTQFADQINIRLNSELISGISRALPKLHRYFNGTAISTSTVPSLSALFLNLDLNLNYLESVMLSSGSTLYYCHKIPGDFE